MGYSISKLKEKMRTEIEWLRNFKENLKATLAGEENKYRKGTIIWELTWIDKRIEELIHSKN